MLQTLLQRAEDERDAAIAIVRQAEGQLRAAEAQARQLNDYRSDFDSRWTQRFQSSGQGTRSLLQCHQSFGLRLGEAISQQQGQTQQVAQRVQRAKAALLQREQRVAAVRKLIERREAEQLRSSERRAQRNEDEMAQRQHQRRQALAG